MSGGKIPSYIEQQANLEARQAANISANLGGDGTVKPIGERLRQIEATLARLEASIARLEGILEGQG